MAQKKNSSLEKQVRDAIRKLIDDGKQITNQTVRDAIGGGSFRDIGPVIKIVKAEIEAKEEAARSAPPMPEDFSDAANAMWDLSWRLADDFAASERRGHAVEVDRLKAEADEAMSNCALVESERDEADKRAQVTAKLLAEAEAALLDAKLEIARLEGQLAEREKYIESSLAEPRIADIIEPLAEDKNTTKPENEAVDRPSANDDDTQLDMFAQEKSGKNKPDTSEAIVAI